MSLRAHFSAAPCSALPLLSLVTLGWPAGVALAQASATAPEPPNADAASPTQQVSVRGRRPVDVGPMPGLLLDKDQIPANLQSAGRQDIKASRALSVADFMNTRMQGVSVNDHAGNPFQVDLNYRGFTASPQVGTPQGLSVFFDGVRVNEPFGDVVNWDLIPMNAIERFDLFPGSNPLFGLNTLGGAISVRSKSGFTAPGLEAALSAGAWGRRQWQLSGGAHTDDLAGFAAVNIFDEAGWRDDSPSRVRQFYGRGDMNLANGTLTASLLGADNRLVGNGLIPQALAGQKPGAVFTSPDDSGHRLWQLTLRASIDLSDTHNWTAQVYRRRSDRDGLGSDAYEGFDDFSDTNGLDVVIDRSRPIGDQIIARNGAKQFGLVGGNVGGTGVVAGTPIGLLTRTALQQTTDGLALQSNWNLPTLRLMAGASVDRSQARYLMDQRLGLIDAGHRVYAAADQIDPIYYAASHDVPGNDFSGAQTTASLYASQTWSPQRNLHLSTALRYNHTRTDTRLYNRDSAAQRNLHELRSTNPDIDRLVNAKALTRERFSYTSLNPSLGLNWLPVPVVNLYANLGQGARVPSVVELGCAFDDTPVEVSNGGKVFGTAPRSLLGAGCSLPTTLSGDPYLPQIRSLSAEAGARGRLEAGWDWNVGAYRTDLRDDIYFVGVGDGKSYFDTIGKTRRQGFELGLSGQTGPLSLKLSYAYTRATFESTFYTLSPHNSSADFDQNSQAFTNRPDLGDVITLPSPTATANGGRGTYRMIRVDPGASLPGVPRHALSASAQWQATPELRVGLGVVVRSGSFVRGNENNQHRARGTDKETGIYYCDPSGGGCLEGLKQQFTRPGRAFTNFGSIAGHTVFNLDLAWQIDRQLSLTLQVANLFNQAYDTAGRLGVNPFSPSQRGAIGSSGWNHNSAEWRNATFVGPGAPRALWLGLNWELDAN